VVTKAQREETEMEKVVSSILWRKFLAFGAVFTLLFGGSMWGIYLRTQRIVIGRVTEQFNEPRIQKILQEVASNEAKSIIENTLNPEIAKMNELIANSRNEIESEITGVKQETKYFEDYIEGTKLSFSKEYATLADEIKFLKQRNILTSLADEAISQGIANPYEELQILPVGEQLQNAKLSEVLRVKNYYATMTRIKGVSIVASEPDGRKTKDDEISTQILLKDLANNENWQIRAKAAQLLKNRKEEIVSESLLKAAKSDPRLDVRKLALDSFAIINDVTLPDVFDTQCAIELLQFKKEKK
jgi:hypothetical protein